MKAAAPVEDVSGREAHRPPLPRRAWTAIKAFWARDPLTLAASIAFYTSLSFAPLLTLAVVAIASTGSGLERAFVEELGAVMGPQVANATALVLSRVDGETPQGPLGALALAAVVFSASAVFGQLQTSINKLWNLDALKPAGWRGWVRQRVVSFGMLIGMAVLLLSTFVASSAMSALLASRMPLVTGLGELVATGLFALAFAMMFRYVPYVRSPWRRCLPAGAVTALLFQTGKWALGLYFAQVGVGDAYGPAGAIVLLMAWVYYVALLILVGSELARPRDAATANDGPAEAPASRLGITPSLLP